MPSLKIIEDQIMGYALIADLIVAFHVAYVSFVIFGQAAILVGVLLRWGWVRNLWFRIAHFMAIAIVAVEALMHIPCPLTIWEDKFRTLAGQKVEDGSFIGRALHSVLFYDLPNWVFTSMYIGFAALVLVTFILATPRWRRPRTVTFASAANSAV